MISTTSEYGHICAKRCMPVVPVVFSVKWLPSNATTRLDYTIELFLGFESHVGGASEFTCKMKIKGINC